MDDGGVGAPDGEARFRRTGDEVEVFERLEFGVETEFPHDPGAHENAGGDHDSHAARQQVPCRTGAHP